MPWFHVCFGAPLVMPLLNFSSLSSIGRRSFQTTRPRCVWLAPVAVLAGVAPMAGGQGAQAELEQVVAPAVAAQSLRLDRLLGDLTATRPETLQGPVWTFEPQPGRELVVLPIAVDLNVSGVTLDDPAFSVQGARFPGRAAAGRHGPDRRRTTGSRPAIGRSRWQGGHGVRRGRFCGHVGGCD